jgi:hypothetical protein
VISAGSRQGAQHLGGYAATSRTSPGGLGEAMAVRRCVRATAFTRAAGGSGGESGAG